MMARTNALSPLGSALTHARQECFRSVLKYKVRRFDFDKLGSIFSKVQPHHKYKLKWEIFDAAIESRCEDAIPELLSIFDEIRDPKNPLLEPAIDYLNRCDTRAIGRLTDIIKHEDGERELRRAACFFLLVVTSYPLPLDTVKEIGSATYPHFQFWDVATPPDVALLMAKFENQCGESYEFFDEGSARSFLSNHFDREVMTAYEKCYHPAMKCDFFRICKLYHTGGSYSDADALPRKGFGDARKKLARKPMFWIWDEYQQVGNWFLSSPPHMRIYERLIREAMFRIGHRDAHRSLYDITGPNMIADVLVENCVAFPADELGAYTNHFGRWNIQTVGAPKYKADTRNWQLYENG